MHIFNMSITYRQSIEKIQWKLYEELISQYMPINHYLLWAIVVKWLFKGPVSFLKNIFSASNSFMHIFSMSVIYMQNAEKIQWKL